MRRMRLLPVRRLATMIGIELAQGGSDAGVPFLRVVEFLEFVLVDDLKGLRQIAFFQIEHDLDLDGHHVLSAVLEGQVHRLVFRRAAGAAVIPVEVQVHAG